MKITKQLAAMTAALAMCMNTMSATVSAEECSLSDEGDYTENLTEEIVAEEEIPVEEEAVPVEEMSEEMPQEDPSAPVYEEPVDELTATDAEENSLELNGEADGTEVPAGDVTSLTGRKRQLPYCDENGTIDHILIWENMSEFYESSGYAGYTLSDGWYYVDQDITFYENRLIIEGDVNLILGDGTTLRVDDGIRCGDQYNNGKNSLTIWAQKEGTGKLVCKSRLWHNSAIGGNWRENCGTINIHGGVINAHGDTYAAGIGGGWQGSGGTVRIYGGKITATGVSGAAGIGGGDIGSSGDIFIYGGDIIAKGIPNSASDPWWGAGIGTGDCGTVNNIHILGGERIECHGYHAIGTGKDGDNGPVVLGDSIEVEGFSWNDRYTALSNEHDLVLKAQ